MLGETGAGDCWVRDVGLGTGAETGRWVRRGAGRDGRWERRRRVRRAKETGWVRRALERRALERRALGETGAGRDGARGETGRG
ncbi:Sugar transporter ERD6-like 12, partial [Clarias magur]